jgi:hypothetical protein
MQGRSIARAEARVISPDASLKPQTRNFDQRADETDIAGTFGVPFREGMEGIGLITLGTGFCFSLRRGRYDR